MLHNFDRCPRPQTRRPVRPPRSFRISKILAVLLMAFSGAGFASGEDESGQLAFPDAEPTPREKSIDADLNPGGRQQGIDGRIGFIGMPAYGRDQSILPVELFPYLQMDNQILFGDLRGFIDTAGQVGGNAGIGYRFIEPNDIALFGINGFYDADDSTSRVFQQLSVGWEARTRWAGAFGNIYMPVGQTNKIISQSITNPRFDANQILFDLRTRQGQAMTGLDLNFQAYIPGQFFEDHQIQALAGWYHFEGGSNAKDINGYKLQLQGNIVPAVGGQVQVTRDQTFGTNVNLGIFWRFGNRELPDASLRGQLRRFVDRNYNVIVTQDTTLNTGVVAQNASTGGAYVVQHVGTNTGTGSGTADDPYTTITAAQNAGADIVFVHGGTTVSDSVVLADGQSLLGEGVAHQLTDARYGRFTLPSAGGTSAGTPQISGSVGNAVTMGNHSIFSGFSIFDPTGNGVVANGVDGFQISNVNVTNAGGDAISITDSSNGAISNISIDGGAGNGIGLYNIDDEIDLKNLTISGVQGDGIHIDGGLGTLNFTGGLYVQNTGGAAFSVENMEKKVDVDDKGTTSTLDDVTTITPSIVSVEQIIVRGVSGGTGISLMNNEGIIGFGAVDVQTVDAPALFVHDTNQVQINNGSLKATNGPVIDAENADVEIALGQIRADGGAAGMRFVNTTGQVSVYGDGKTAGSGGSISNTDVGILMQNAGAIGLQLVNFTDNAKVAEVHGGSVLAITGSTITGTTDTIIDATNLIRLQVYQSTFSNNTITSGHGILFQTDTVGSYTAAVSNNTVDGTSGTFFKAQTLSGGETSSLTYAFQQNAVKLTADGGIAAAMNWTGPALAYVTNNSIAGAAANQIAFQMLTGTGTDLGQIQVSQNLIAMAGANSIGIDVNALSPVNAVINSNQIDFNGLNGIGIRASMAKASALAIGSNVITDFVGGATGILMSSLENQTQVAIDGNTIDLSMAGTFVDRGIVLSNVTANDGSTSPVVQFFATSDNTIKGATTPYVFPTTGTSGAIIINTQTIRLP